MSFCPNCGKQVKEGAKFCDGCGSKMPGREAPHMHEEIDCPYCGSNLTLQHGFSKNNEFYHCNKCNKIWHNGDWYCKSCGASLNKQYGFSDRYNSWKCSKCSYVNQITFEEIYASEEEYQGKIHEHQNKTQRTKVYEGVVHKCPSCGETLKSFLPICPSCGHEFRNTKASSPVLELSRKIEELEKGRTNNEKSDKKNITKGNNTSVTDEKIISLIKTYPIPNNKEDVLEFLILAISNIREEDYDTYLNENKRCGCQCSYKS